MSYALVFGGIAALVVCIGGITALFWWTSRSVPRGRRFTCEPLPLFSHVHASVWARDDEQVPEEGTAADLIAARVARSERDRTPIPSWTLVPPAGSTSKVSGRSDVP